MFRISLMLVLSAAVAWSASAAVYQCEDDLGNTIYTDQACRGGKQVTISPGMSYTPPPTPKVDWSRSSQTEEPEDAGPAYTFLAIVQPGKEATLRSHEGIVRVSLAVGPGLGEGHRFELLLDGRRQPVAATAPNLTLADVERGEHSLRAQVVDGKGVVMIESAPVTFFMHKTAQFQGHIVGKGKNKRVYKPHQAPQSPSAFKSPQTRPYIDSSQPDDPPPAEPDPPAPPEPPVEPPQ